MKASAALLLLPALVAAAPTPDVAPASAAPAGLQVHSFTYGGSGCEGGTASVAVTPDGSTITLSANDFNVKLGGDAAVTDRRENCQVNVDFILPAGYQYALASADYRGTAATDAGTDARVSTTTYFSGDKEQNRVIATVEGPTNAPFARTNSFATAPWSACGGESAININTALTLTRTGSSGTASLSSNNQVFHLKFQKC